VRESVLELPDVRVAAFRGSVARCNTVDAFPAERIGDVGVVNNATAGRHCLHYRHHDLRQSSREETFEGGHAPKASGLARNQVGPALPVLGILKEGKRRGAKPIDEHGGSIDH